MSHRYTNAGADTPGLTLVTMGGAALYAHREDGQAEQVLGPGKHTALLAYLALSPRKSAARDQLIDLLWSDLDPRDARHALRQAVWYLRQRAGDDVVLTREGDLVIGRAIELDRDLFVGAVERGELEEAVRLYRGDFLAGFAAPGGAEYEHWADVERYRLQLAYTEAAETLARRHLSAARFRDAQRIARELRDVAPHRQRSWRLLIEALLSGGDRAQAASEAKALERTLESEGREPEPATAEMLRRAMAPMPAPGAEGPGRDAPLPDPQLYPELIGREAEFATLLRAWDAARGGTPQHVHVTGSAGIGKTRLLADAAARLRASGVRTISVRAHQAEMQMGFAVASDLAARLAALPGSAAVSAATAAVLVGLNPTLSGRFDVEPDRSSGNEALRRRSLALQELLAAVADESPLAVLLDDLHWVDTFTLQILQGLVARLERDPVLVVTTARPAPLATIGRPGTMEIALQPLSLAEVGLLVASIGRLPDDEPWPDRLLSALHEATSGSPLLVVESLQLGLERGSLALRDAAWQSPDPAQLLAELAAGGTLRHRLEQLDRGARWVLQLLALAGMPLTSEQLARATQTPPEDLLPSIGALERRGFVVRTGNRYLPAHDEMTELTREAMEEPAVRAARAALGRALAPPGTDDTTLLRHAARHLVSAGEARDAVPLVEAWARRMRSRGDRRPLPILAAECLGERNGAPAVHEVIRSLPLRVRARFLRRRSVVAASAVLLLALVGSVTVLGFRDSAPHERSLFVFGPMTAAEVGVVALQIDAETWTGAGPLDVPRAGTRLPITFPRSTSSNVPLARPGGADWVSTRVFPDSGGEDLVLVDPRGERRLTFAPGDDHSPAWSPDGRFVAFLSARWHPRSWTGIGVLDLASGEVRRLASSDSAYLNPTWSPDGTRIAYLRTDRVSPAAQVCWITVDGEEERCHREPLANGNPFDVGWVDERALLLTVAQGDSVRLATLDVEVDTLDYLDFHMARSQFVRAAIGGWWLALESRRIEHEASQWTVFPLRRPELARPLLLEGGDGSDYTLQWDADWARHGHLDSLAVDVPAAGIALAAPHRLRVWGVGSRGGIVTPRVLTYRIADTTVAVVRPSGMVIPRRPGATTVTVSAGGWVRTSVPLVVTAPGDSTVLREDWGDAHDARWRAFGDPRPVLAAGPDGVPGFWNRGDGSYPSGAYSAQEFPVDRGVGVEAMLSAPVDLSQWQELGVALISVDSTALADWDHTTGYLPGHERGDGARLCAFEYPAGASAVRTRRLYFQALSRDRRLQPVTADLASGRWFRVVLQLFPDGTCGIAIDGVPLARSARPVTHGRTVRAVLGLASLDNLMLHGPLRVWTGVTDTVDWFELAER
jgi:DNA-binding SARP family transcriptional activator